MVAQSQLIDHVQTNGVSKAGAGWPLPRAPTNHAPLRRLPALKGLYRGQQSHRRTRTFRALGCQGSQYVSISQQHQGRPLNRPKRHERTENSSISLPHCASCRS